MLSVIGGWGHPLLVSVAGIVLFFRRRLFFPEVRARARGEGAAQVWIFARLDYARSYAAAMTAPGGNGAAGLGLHTWSSLLLIVAAAVSTGATLLLAD